MTLHRPLNPASPDPKPGPGAGIWLLQYQIEGTLPDVWFTLCDESGPIQFDNTQKFIADRVFWASKHRASAARFIKAEDRTSLDRGYHASMSRINAKTRKSETSHA